MDGERKHQCVLTGLVFLGLCAAIVSSAFLCGCDSGKEDQATELDKHLTLDLGNGVTMKLVLIPAGKFLMRVPGEIHEQVFVKS